MTSSDPPAGGPPEEAELPPAPREPTTELPVIDAVEERVVLAAGGNRRVVIAGVAVLLVVLAVFIVDALAARSAERQASERLSAALGTTAEVRLRGWPVGLRLVTNRPLDARVIALDVPVPGRPVALTRLQLDLEAVETVGGGWDDAAAVVIADRATFVADLDDDAVQELAGIVGRIPLVDVELQRGVARLVVAGFPIVDATAEVVDGRIVFSPAAPLGAVLQLTLELDELPYGFVADDVEIRRGTLRLTGTALHPRFNPP